MGTACILSRPPQVRSKTIDEVRGYANPTAKNGEYTGSVLFICKLVWLALRLEYFEARAGEL